MTYRWLERTRSALALVACCAFACGSSALSPPPSDGGTASVQFDQGGNVLALMPKDTAMIGISATGVDQVTVSLTGNYLDAFLGSDAAHIVDGHATITLQAPSSPTTFSVLAVAGNATPVRLDVAVSATGFADVRVTTDYQGKRAVPIVAASTFVETTCAALGNKPIDGSPLALGTYGDQIVIKSVPTDGQVAVAVRIAHYATGCFDVASLTPGDTRDVTVEVFDLPLDLADSALETRFTFAPDSSDASSLQTYFQSTVGSTVLEASFAASGSESSRLLDAMSAASTSSSQFQSARTSKSWDVTVQTWLGAHLPSLHDRAQSWLVSAAMAGVGDLTGHFTPDATSPAFTPEGIGAISATTAGVTAPLAFAWSGQPGDVLSISGGLSIVPSQLACAEADASAIADVPTSTGVASALAIDIDCADLASTLAGGGDAFGTCDATCMQGLCSTALTSLWTSGAQSMTKPSEALSLTLSVAAPVQVGDTANVLSYVGTWVGSFGYSTSKVSTKGVAKGAFGAIPN